MRSFMFPIVVSVGVALVTNAAVGLAEPGSEGATPDAATAAPAQAGSWIHVDPQTGKRIPGPPPGVVALPPDPAFSTSHQGLAEKPAPGGGMMIDLQGRFQSAGTATIGPDGKPHHNCVLPGTADRKE